MNPLERKTLSVRLADEIERSIRNGEWTGLLPGHRALMKTYSVSAKTCIAAIDQLETRKIISAGEQGKRRRILIKGNAATRKLETLLMIDDMTAPSGGHSIVLHAYRSAWEESGGRVINLRFDFPRYRHPERLLRETVERYRADAILLQVATQPWIQAAIALRPTYLDGGAKVYEEATSVSYSMGAETRRVATMLHAMGHRRIAAPQELLAKTFEQSIRRNLGEVLGLSPTSAQIAALCPIFPESVPAAWNGYWKKLFASVRPTAVILNKDLHVHSLLGFCSRHGIAIPRDLSIVCLESTDSLAWCDPSPTRMRFPAEIAIGVFRKWIRGGCRNLGWKTVELEYVEGATIAPPR
ncbi:LacI family DNA-binding transcriptional regulator [Luteolibacter ambystomatis]|uniref:LacI family DNA-binding transcriptional regulator n=1 Tax=Luteolibacter ambystomatis TaxID=2824561 RepID=A0A975G5W9_9BACT|nr:substrate-binding domain-containing protein [Luteolibacter ambystomatis]QUE49373.1 LacI family DNA-binding transcriptional regulator [Luteolibacter ambystomatis]